MYMTFVVKQAYWSLSQISGERLYKMIEYERSSLFMRQMIYYLSPFTSTTEREREREREMTIIYLLPD